MLSHADQLGFGQLAPNMGDTYMVCSEQGVHPEYSALKNWLFQNRFCPVGGGDHKKYC